MELGDWVGHLALVKASLNITGLREALRASWAVAVDAPPKSTTRPSLFISATKSCNEVEKNLYRIIYYIKICIYVILSSLKIMYETNEDLYMNNIYMKVFLYGNNLHVFIFLFVVPSY